MIRILKERVLSGGLPVSFEEAVELSQEPEKELLYEAANQIRLRFCGNRLDTCSIINARSGGCSEDCKWCAQSAFHQTGVTKYRMKSAEEVLASAQENDRLGIRRFSLVTGGRRVGKKDLEVFCAMYREIKEKTSLKTCASMGLIGREELQQLKEAGVQRYECNLETASSYFSKLCSTHTSEDKKQTLRLAREVGLELCSGGIIGMGESMRQRIELAFELKELGVKSVPINVLTPVKGTRLENRPALSDSEILTTISVFRFILPDAFLRFAGGRSRMSPQVQLKALRAGLNASLMGGLLTTPGTDPEEDYRLFERAGYTCR